MLEGGVEYLKNERRGLRHENGSGMARGRCRMLEKRTPGLRYKNSRRRGGVWSK